MLVTDAVCLKVLDHENLLLGRWTLFGYFDILAETKSRFMCSCSRWQ